MSEIEDLERAVVDARKTLEQAELALADARVRSYPHRVGDVVEAATSGEWKPAIVREVEPQSWGPWYKVSFKTKGGDWSNRAIRVFEKVRVSAGPNTVPHGEWG